MYPHVGAGFAILMALLSIRPLSADDQSPSRTFTLQHMTARDAATVVRTIAGIRELTAPDDRTIEVTATEGSIQLAAELLSALDAPKVEPSQTFTTGDETVVSVIPLRNISPSEAMAALREIKIQRVSATGKPAVVVVRDTAEQVELAVEALDETSSDQHD